MQVSWFRHTCIYITMKYVINAKYEERKRIVNRITELFSGTDYENLICRIVDVVILSDRPKVLYLNSLKTFGRKAGIEVYRKIRNGVLDI